MCFLYTKASLCVYNYQNGRKNSLFKHLTNSADNNYEIRRYKAMMNSKGSDNAE